MHIEKRGNSLLIRFKHDGKPYSFSLPKHNNPIGISAAKLKMAQIEKDIRCERFDTTLLRYKPRRSGKNPTDITAVELVEKYIAHRRESLANGSIVRLEAIASKLKQLLGNKSAEKVNSSVAKDTVARWSESASSQSIRTYLFMLRACWDWGKGKYHMADFNPWVECLERAQTRGSNHHTKRKAPFTIPELHAIIAAFVSHPQYKHYAEFVIFLASTGCRPGEAVGLRWKHLGADYSKAWIGESISRGYQNSRGTKTGKSRTIHLSPSVRSMMVSRFDRLSPKLEDLVFPSPRGLPIDDHNFSNRAWKTILTNCHIEYRSPYQLRHTAISHALHNGANAFDLAEQTVLNDNDIGG